MAKSKTPKTILIIEDEEAIIGILKEKLGREGFTIFLARDGREGLKQATEKKPDLILLDILMPGMDGMTMLKKLRKTSWGKKADVIILTNLSYEVKEEEAGAHGVRDYWVKSDWKIDDIARKIKTRLK